MSFTSWTVGTSLWRSTQDEIRGIEWARWGPIPQWHRPRWTAFVGSQDIEVGYPGFDDNYVIQGTSEHRVRKFCENERIRELIASQPRIHLEVRDDEGWFKAHFPERVDQLYFQCHGVIKDIGRLEKLFEMVAESLHQLCHDGKVYEDDIDIHIGRLSGPGGTIKGKHVLWEGDPPRHDAAQALGRLKDPKVVEALASVLWSEDTTLRALAIDAFVSIGHPNAIGLLIPLLGDTSPAAEKHRVRSALRRLGQGELVDDVLAALAGAASRIKGAVGEYREQVIDALVNALDGASPIHAAKVLEELHAMEALLAMREILRMTGTSNRTGQAIDAAIQALEARAALPRPAEGRELVPDTLPRAADDPAPATDTLPRATE